MEKAKKAKFEIPAVKVDFLEGTALQAIKDREAVKHGPKVSATAISMSGRMLTDINAGARIQLGTPSLMRDKEQIKKFLKKDLGRLAKKAKKNYSVRVVDEDTALVFYYEQKAPKKEKEKAAA